MKLKHLSIFFLMCCSTTTDTKADAISVSSEGSTKADITTCVEQSNLNSSSFISNLPQSPNYIYKCKSHYDLLKLATVKSSQMLNCKSEPSFKLKAGDYCKRVLLDDSDDCILDVTLILVTNFFKIPHADCVKGISFFNDII